MPNIICGKCKELHHSAAAVKACYAGNLHVCDWLVKGFEGWDDGEGYGESWEVIVPCGAEAIVDSRGFTCSVGHSHVYAEIRYAEGWEYAEDANEASRLAKAGIEPRDLVSGGAFRA
jgi:hypothetical protein